MISKRRGTVAVIGLLPMLSCGEDSTAPPDPRPEPPRPAVVIVNPASVRLVGLGDTVQLTAEVRDQNGRTMTGVGVTWQTDDASIATVDSTGLVQAIGEGVVSIAATAGAASGRARVEVTDPDRAVLSTFCEATGGANWKRSENWLMDAPLDQWLGVRTDEQGRVTHVHLQDNNIRGPIVPELGDLAHLTSLIIWQNPLSGPIPPELGNLSQLRQLELSLDTENTLEGPIPPQLGNLSLLRSFYLHGDGVTGPIPPEFGQLSDLSLLSLAGEQLSGPAPRVLLRLTNLNFALLGFCLPDASDWISWAEGIATLHVSFCNEGDVSVLNTLYHGTGGPDWTNNEGWLQGPIAEWYGVTADSIGFVTALDLSHNGLTGQLPSGLGQLEHLTELSIDGNRLTGPLPLSLAGTRLRTFRYGDTDLCVPPDSTFRAWLNSIESHVGTDVQCAPSDRQVLEALYASTGGPNWKRSEHWLSDRPLGEWHGVSVDSGGRVTAIELRNNGLIGSLPLTLGSLTELRDLAIPFNGLSGPVPAQLSELAELRTLFLGHNELSGSIPPEIGELPQLRYLDLEGNRLTGELPSSLSGLDSLVAMWLERNEFTGPIPPELSDLTQLRQLKLSRNRLTGGIPPELGNLFQLDEFDVARTDLTGELPPELGELRRLRKLDVSATGLEGEIPGNLVHLPSLELFSWSDTELCSPISRTFQDWLADIEGVRGEPCVRAPLTAFYRSAGGEGWTRNANWLTPGPVADWHGVTVDDRGLPVSLELGDNGLVGSVAPELGEFVELRALDLSGSALTGQLPGELGRLDRLRTLDISDNQFTGALPSSFVELAELASFRWDNSGACAPSASWFQNWLRSIEDQVAGAGCGEVPVLLGMPSVYLNQAVQDAGAHVPLVAGRPALLRVHATADQANEYQPRARALFFQ